MRRCSSQTEIVFELEGVGRKSVEESFEIEKIDKQHDINNIYTRIGKGARGPPQSAS